MAEKKLMTMQELLKSGRIYWIKSPQTLKKWVERDISRRNILKTVVEIEPATYFQCEFYAKLQKHLEPFL